MGAVGSGVAACRASDCIHLVPGSCREWGRVRVKYWSQQDFLVAGLALAVGALTLAFDLSVPLGVAGGVPYAIMVVVGLWLPNPFWILALAALGTALTAVGYTLSAAGGTTWVVLTNRALALLIIWTCAGLAFYLHRRTTAAIAAAKAKSNFLPSMSHELRTPLNAVLGFAQVLEADKTTPLTETHKNFVDEILHSGRQLLGLIDSLLDFAQVDGTDLPLKPVDLAPRPIIEGCLDAVAEDAGRNRIVLSNRVPADGLPPIRIDAFRFRQAVTTLLTNAVKYNHTGGRVFIEYSVRPDRKLRISVRDTGKGIPDDKQGQVFEAFNRLGVERSATMGAGVDLAVTRQMMEKMGGGIGFESLEGVGSTFWIEAPLAVEIERRPDRGRQ